MKITFLIVLVVIAGIVVAQLVLSGMFKTKVDDLKRRLVASQLSVAPDQSLIPVMVRKFAARNGGQVGGATSFNLVQSAEMRLQPDQAFFHIDATQVSGTRNPGFVWLATGRMAGILPLQVVDSYVAGSGWLEARIAGAIPVASALGPDIDKGEAMRFLAELPWNPDALINARGLSWEQVDDLTVKVAMETRGGLARVSLLFNAEGDVVGITADDRPRAVGNASLPTKWAGRFSDYEQAGAYRWPRHGEIGWVLPDGEFVYWRGDVLSVTPAST